MSGWTHFKWIWSGPPLRTMGEALDLGHTILITLPPLRALLVGLRWHYKWTAVETETEVDFLRVECGVADPRASQIAAQLQPKAAELGKEIALESWLDDGVYHACWTRNSTDSFASVWWRWSELVLELAAPGRNISWREIYGLYPSAFAYFTGQDDRPLQESLRALGVDSPERALYALREAMLADRYPISYVNPPTSDEQARDTARIHYLMSSIFAPMRYLFLLPRI